MIRAPQDCCVAFKVDSGDGWLYGCAACESNTGRIESP